VKIQNIGHRGEPSGRWEGPLRPHNVRIQRGLCNSSCACRQRRHWSCLGRKVQQPITALSSVRFHLRLHASGTVACRLLHSRRRCLISKEIWNRNSFCAHIPTFNCIFVLPPPIFRWSITHIICIVTLKFFGTIRLGNAARIYITWENWHKLNQSRWWRSHASLRSHRSQLPSANEHLLEGCPYSMSRSRGRVSSDAWRHAPKTKQLSAIQREPWA